MKNTDLNQKQIHKNKKAQEAEGGLMATLIRVLAIAVLFMILAVGVYKLWNKLTG